MHVHRSALSHLSVLRTCKDLFCYAPAQVCTHSSQRYARAQVCTHSSQCATHLQRSVLLHTCTDLICYAPAQVCSATHLHRSAHSVYCTCTGLHSFISVCYAPAKICFATHLHRSALIHLSAMHVHRSALIHLSVLRTCTGLQNHRWLPPKSAPGLWDRTCLCSRSRAS